MNPELTRAGLRIGFTIALPAGLLLLWLEPDTAEHSITLVTFAMGVVFLLAITALALFRRR